MWPLKPLLKLYPIVLVKLHRFMSPPTQAKSRAAHLFYKADGILMLFSGSVL
jgi:hypothetical protein